ncbi:hypothetical protein LINPERHAP2_LOCUS24393 [Linum perenne]
MVQIWGKPSNPNPLHDKSREENGSRLWEVNVGLTSGMRSTRDGESLTGLLATSDGEMWKGLCRHRLCRDGGILEKGKTAVSLYSLGVVAAIQVSGSFEIFQRENKKGEKGGCGVAFGLAEDLILLVCSIDCSSNLVPPFGHLKNWVFPGFHESWRIVLAQGSVALVSSNGNSELKSWSLAICYLK